MKAPLRSFSGTTRADAFVPDEPERFTPIGTEAPARRPIDPAPGANGPAGAIGTPGAAAWRPAPDPAAQERATGGRTAAPRTKPWTVAFCAELPRSDTGMARRFRLRDAGSTGEPKEVSCARATRRS